MRFWELSNTAETLRFPASFQDPAGDFLVIYLIMECLFLSRDLLPYNAKACHNIVQDDFYLYLISDIQSEGPIVSCPGESVL